MKYSYKLTDLEQTKVFAIKVAQVLQPNFVITLNGDLGAGKTTLTREILYALGVTGSVKSPTFTLVEPYVLTNYHVYHFDLYRFNDPDEWFDAGFDDYFSESYICFIEWASKASQLIPQIDWVIQLEMQPDNSRLIMIETKTKLGDECLKKLIINVES